MNTYEARFYTNSDGQYTALVCANDSQDAADLIEYHEYFYPGGCLFPGGICQLRNATDEQQLTAAVNTERLARKRKEIQEQEKNDLHPNL